jgi:hypothetical protein
VSKLRKIIVPIILATVVPILAASLIYLWDNKNRILKHFPFTENVAIGKYDMNQNDLYWAKKINKGGYILHFRHAERDKWIDVQMYDAIESDIHTNGENGSRFAEDDYFNNAVCLNDRGIIQARAMGEIIKHVKLPIGPVISSPSCRARQTAELVFGGYASMDRNLVHPGPYNETTLNRTNTLLATYKALPQKPGKNTIVSAHNSVIVCDMFVNRNDCPREPFLEEGGFYVLSLSPDGGIYYEHEFHNFNDFSKAFFIR